MLLPPFRGADLKAFDKADADVTGDVFAPSGFMKVDADYAPKPYEEWKASDWPKTYQSVKYANVWAAGIAFAPPDQMSRPRTSPNGTVIALSMPLFVRASLCPLPPRGDRHGGSRCRPRGTSQCAQRVGKSAHESAAPDPGARSSFVPGGPPARILPCVS